MSLRERLLHEMQVRGFPVVLMAELDALLRSEDTVMMDWLEGWLHDGLFDLDMNDLCHGYPTLRAAITAMRAASAPEGGEHE